MSTSKKFAGGVRAGMCVSSVVLFGPGLCSTAGESVTLFRQASGSWRVRLLQITTIKVTRTSCGTHDLFGGLLNILRKIELSNIT